MPATMRFPLLLVPQCCTQVSTVRVAVVAGFRGEKRCQFFLCEATRWLPHPFCRPSRVLEDFCWRDDDPRRGVVSCANHCGMILAILGTLFHFVDDRKSMVDAVMVKVNAISRLFQKTYSESVFVPLLDPIEPLLRPRRCPSCLL